MKRARVIEGQERGLRVRTWFPPKMRMNGVNQGSRGQGRNPEVDEHHWDCGDPVSYTHLDVYKRQDKKKRLTGSR